MSRCEIILKICFVRSKILYLLMLLIIISCLKGQKLELHEQSVFTDPRDGRTYKTVRIGDQVWMAENLNYGGVVADCDQRNNGIVEKTFYQNDSTLGAIYGGLYTWDEAMNYQKTEGSQGICPEGWHIPTLSEWRQLAQFLGADSAGQLLKASPNDPIPWDGNNRSGFTAIPSGGVISNISAGKDSGRSIGHPRSLTAPTPGSPSWMASGIPSRLSTKFCIWEITI